MIYVELFVEKEGNGGNMSSNKQKPIRFQMCDFERECVRERESERERKA